MHAPIPRGTVVYMGNARLPARIETSGKAVEKTALSRLWYVMEKQGDRVSGAVDAG
jgi:predicted PP-loop superfamily ATPase